MRTSLRWSSLLLSVLPLHALAADQWILATDLWGNSARQTLNLDVQGTQVSGTLGGDPISGSLNGAQLKFTATGSDGQVYHYDGRIDGSRMQGRSDEPDTNNRSARATHDFSAWRVPSRPDKVPRLHDFTPSDYSNTFSAERAPALVIWPGDSVRTKTLDSGGVDEHGITRA
ncbi:MAG: hypothetical protein ACN6OR_14460, partial [Stenotrophomonas sp.]